MTATLTVHDQLTTGGRSAGITLAFPTERITVRELIRARIYQEVQDYNQRTPAAYTGLVQPTAKEQTLNGKLEERKPVDWQKQFEIALAAFEANHVLVLVNDRQSESLEEVIELNRQADVTFLKLTPLVGG